MSVATNRILSRGASLLGELNNIEDNEKKEKKENTEKIDNIQLPVYIIYYILAFLRRTELQVCTGVSKQWRTVASDSCFGWYPFHTFPLSASYLYIYNYKFFEQTWHEIATKYSKTVPEFQSMIATRDKYGYDCDLTTKTQVEKLKVQDHTAILNLQKCLEACKTNPKLWRYEVLVGNLSDYLKDNKNTIRGEDSFLFQEVKYLVLFEINVRELERIVEKEEISEIPNLAAIRNVVTEEHYAVSDNLANDYESDASYIPVKGLTTQKQPRGLAKNLKLYKYQLDAVAWLKSIEEDVDVGYDMIELIPWRGPKTSVLFNYKGTPVAKADYNNYKKRILPRGGILADEIGLGKTMEIITLAANEKKEKENDNENKDEVKEENDKEQNDANYHINLKKEELFVTNATLVVCPEHLIKQWHSEIEKYTRPILNVVELTNVNQIKATKYSDIVNADVVLVSMKLIENENYRKIGMKLKKKPYRNVRLPFIEKRLREEIKTSKNPLEEKQIILEHFYWRRIVIDEAHETTQSFIDKTGPYNSKYWWYVSATPFPDQYSVDTAKLFLNSEDLSYDTRAIRVVYFDILKNNLLWRNTKESVKNEYTIPPIVEELVLLNLTPLETAIYNYFEWEYKYGAVDMISYFPLHRQFVTNSSLETIRQKMIGYLNDKIKSHEDAIKAAKKDIEMNQKEIEHKNKQVPVVNVSSIHNRITRDTERIADLEGNIVKYKKTITLVEDAPAGYTGKSMDTEVTFPDDFEEPTKDENMNESESKEKDKEDKEKEDDDEGDEEDEVNEQEVALPWSDILDMKVARLKEELDMRKVEYQKNERKADLQKLLKEAVKNTVGNEKSTSTKKEKGKRKSPGSAEKPTKKKQKVAKDEADNNNNTPKSTIEDKIKEKNILNWLIEKDGTKLANLTLYLKRVWTDTPSAKVIIFSQYQKLLNKISTILAERNVDHATLVGGVQNRVRQMNSFKKNSEIRALLLDITSVASGTNIIEATHIILMEPFKGEATKTKAFEDQAIGRAYRQGQTVQVTVARFVVRDTEEYKTYVACYGGAVESSTTDGTQSGHAKLQRSSSLVNSLASASPSEAIRLLEDDNLL